MTQDTLSASSPSALVAMCGLAFSGKSTLAQMIADEIGAHLIVLDEINDARGLNGGDGSVSEQQWTETHLIALDQARRHLDENRSVVLDDTFSHRVLRDRAARLAMDTGAVFSIAYMDVPLDIILKRRDTNDISQERRFISDEVFDSHRVTFQHPDKGEPFIRVDQLTNLDVIRSYILRAEG